jgi:hypothetical protein
MENSCPDEATPLLNSRPTTAESQQEFHHRSSQRRVLLQTFVHHIKKWRTVYLCGIFLLAVDIPGYVGEIAKIRMYELSICRRFYQINDPSKIDGGGNIPEMLCKGKQVQSELATLRGVQSFLDELMSIVFMVPYGLLADMRGRKFVVYLSVLGLLLAEIWTVFVLNLWDIFPTEAVYASTAFKIIGGGNNVVLALFLAIIADACSPEMRYVLVLWTMVTS